MFNQIAAQMKALQDDGIAQEFEIALANPGKGSPELQEKIDDFVQQTTNLLVQPKAHEYLDTGFLANLPPQQTGKLNEMNLSGIIDSLNNNPNIKNFLEAISDGRISLQIYTDFRDTMLSSEDGISPIMLFAKGVSLKKSTICHFIDEELGISMNTNKAIIFENFGDNGESMSCTSLDILDLIIRSFYAIAFTQANNILLPSAAPRTLN